MATAYTISQEELDIVPTPDLLKDYIRKHISHIRNGDVLHIGDNEDDNLAFWSSTKGVILPDFEVGNESGTVPSDFQVGNGINEFPPTHWMNVWDEYDGHIWLSADLMSEIHTNLIKNIEDTYTCNIVIRGKKFKIESVVSDPTIFELMSDTLIVSYE
jgi:hypothetical protein